MDEHLFEGSQQMNHNMPTNKENPVKITANN